MEQAQSELVAVKLDGGWFLSVRKGDPAEGLLVTADTVRLINASVAMLQACETARRTLATPDQETETAEAQALRECAASQLDYALHLAEHGPPGMGHDESD
jgi:hypothetical protein